MGSCPDGGKRYSDLHKTSRRTLGSIKPAVPSVRAPFRGVRRTGREVDHSPLSGAEISCEWSCASTPPRRLRGADRVNCTCCPRCGLYTASSSVYSDEALMPRALLRTESQQFGFVTGRCAQLGKETLTFWHLNLAFKF